MSAVTEYKQIDGKPAFRMSDWPVGVWRTSRSAFDAMVDLVERTLDVKRSTIYEAIGVDGGAASRVRHGAQGLPDRWVLNMSDYSGIPVSELRLVAGIEPTVFPHPKARKA